MNKYKELGWQNGWNRKKEGGVPYEYLRCRDAGHQRREKNIGKCRTQVFCDTCWITYKYDSSD